MSLKILKIIHIALVLGLVIFGIVAYFSGEGFVTQFTMEGDFYIYLVPSIAILAYFGSKLLFKQIRLAEKNIISKRICLFIICD